MDTVECVFRQSDSDTDKKSRQTAKMLTSRQSDRKKTDRQAGRHKDRQTGRLADRQTDRQTDRQMCYPSKFFHN
jgi:hypothetical protein